MFPLRFLFHLLIFVKKFNISSFSLLGGIISSHAKGHDEGNARYGIRSITQRSSFLRVFVKTRFHSDRKEFANAIFSPSIVKTDRQNHRARKRVKPDRKGACSLFGKLPPHLHGIGFFCRSNEPTDRYEKRGANKTSIPLAYYRV